MRVDWLYLTGRTDLLEESKRILHVAPEVCIARRLESLPNISYVSADYASALAMERMDVTDIAYPDESFDVILCNHVLNCVPADRQAMSEIFRVLCRGGWALLQVGIDPTRDATLERAKVSEPRSGRLGLRQDETVRIYALDYSERLREAGFEVSLDDFVKELPATTIDRLGLDVSETIYLCRKR